MEALLLLSLFAVCVVIGAWLQKPKESSKPVYEATALRYQPLPSSGNTQNVYSYKSKTIPSSKQPKASESVPNSIFKVPQIIPGQSEQTDNQTDNQTKNDKHNIVGKETPPPKIDEKQILKSHIEEQIKTLEKDKTELNKRFISDGPGKIGTENLPGNYRVRDEVKKEMKSTMDTTVTFYTLLLLAVPFSFYYLICLLELCIFFIV